jgi:hypothetical protein
VEPTVAIKELLLLQLPPDAVLVSVVMAPAHRERLPEIVPGAVFTVTVTAAVQLPIAYTIEVVPAAIAETMPLEEPTVAIEVFELLHTPPLTELLNVVVPPEHIPNVPVIADGAPFTVTTTALRQPLPVL